MVGLVFEEQITSDYWEQRRYHKKDMDRHKTSTSWFICVQYLEVAVSMR